MSQTQTLNLRPASRLPRPEVVETAAEQEKDNLKEKGTSKQQEKENLEGLDNFDLVNETARSMIWIGLCGCKPLDSGVQHRRNIALHPTFQGSGFGFRDSSFKFGVSGFGFGVSGFRFGFGGLRFRFPVSGSMSRVSGFKIRVAGFGFRGCEVRFQTTGTSEVAGFWFRDSKLGSRASSLGLGPFRGDQANHGFRESGLGFRG